MKGTYNLPAPGDLETVRQFMNTWLVPSATRVGEDRLPALLRDDIAWGQAFPQAALGPDDSVEKLVALRDDLRGMLDSDDWTDALNGWLARLPPVTQVTGPGAEATVRHTAAAGSGVAGWMLAAVVDAVAAGTWSRLKRCPDCQWVFYDRTRSRSKVWCDMLSGDAGGRSCGTIAKVRRYRERQAS